MDSPLPALFHPAPPPTSGGLGMPRGWEGGNAEAQSTACACFPIWNSRSRLPLCSKAMETQGSPLPCVCAGKAGGGGASRGQRARRTSDYPQTKRPPGLPPSSLGAFTTGLAHLPPLPRKEELEVAAAKAAGYRVGGKARRGGKIEKTH